MIGLLKLINSAELLPALFSHTPLLALAASKAAKSKVELIANFTMATSVLSFSRRSFSERRPASAVSMAFCLRSLARRSLFSFAFASSAATTAASLCAVSALRFFSTSFIASPTASSIVIFPSSIKFLTAPATLVLKSPSSGIEVFNTLDRSSSFCSEEDCSTFGIL